MQINISYPAQFLDNENPVLHDIPSDISVTADLGQPTAVVNWTTPTAEDNSGNVLLSEAPVDPGSKFNIGITCVTYIAEDLSKNKAFGTFIVQVTGTLISKQSWAQVVHVNHVNF